MLIRVFKLAIAMFFLSTAGLIAQEIQGTWEVDLAESGAATTRTVDSGTTVGALLVKNRLPHGIYNLSAIRRAIEVEPLPLPEFKRPAEEKAPGRMVLDPCRDLRDAASEAEVDLILESSGLECPLTTSIHSVGLKVGRNEELVITIVRVEPSPKTWVLTFTTGRDGKWYTTYGFTFLPNRDKRYFARPEEEGFSIAEEKDREDLDFRPSILFHYQLPRTHNHSLVAGLGYDLENIALFGGYGYTFNSNVTLTAGLAIHEKTELVGRYEVGDPLAEAIDSAQLVSKTFAPNFYLGISFRFGSNVFGGGE